MSGRILKEGWKCPSCGSTLFHIEEHSESITIRCWKKKLCGWSCNMVYGVFKVMQTGAAQL